VGFVLAADPGEAQRFEYVITVDNVGVEGPDGVFETLEIVHREQSGAGKLVSPAEVEADKIKRSERLGEVSSQADKTTQGESSVDLLLKPDKTRRSERPPDLLPKVSRRSFDSVLPSAPSLGGVDPGFVQAGFRVEAFWAANAGTPDAYFKPGHFHPPDLSSGFEAQHLGNPNELHGILIRSVDGKRFGLKSLRYRVTRNRQLPNKPFSLEGFSNFDVNVLVARSYDPRVPVRAQFVAFPVGLPVGNDLKLPWWTLRIFGFELVDRVYIASSASVDLDDIVLTRIEPPPAPPERRDEEK